MALTDKLTAIADAIRGKTGKTDGLTLDQMAAEIAGFGQGGSGGSANGNVYFNTWKKTYTVTAEDVANYTPGDYFAISIDGLSGYVRFMNIRFSHGSTGGTVINHTRVIVADPQNKYKNYRQEYNNMQASNTTVNAWIDRWGSYSFIEAKTDIKASGVANFKGNGQVDFWKGSYWADSNVYPLTSFTWIFVFDTLVEGFTIDLQVIEEVAV